MKKIVIMMGIFLITNHSYGLNGSIYNDTIKNEINQKILCTSLIKEIKSRQLNQKSKLIINDGLINAAEYHCLGMENNGFFSHADYRYDGTELPSVLIEERITPFFPLSFYCDMKVSEICAQNVLPQGDVNKLTYTAVAKLIVDIYFKSNKHKNILLNQDGDPNIIYIGAFQSINYNTIIFVENKNTAYSKPNFIKVNDKYFNEIKNFDLNGANNFIKFLNDSYGEEFYSRYYYFAFERYDENDNLNKSAEILREFIYKKYVENYMGYNNELKNRRVIYYIHRQFN